MTRDGFDPAVLRAAYDAVAPEYAQTFGATWTYDAGKTAHEQVTKYGCLLN